MDATELSQEMGYNGLNGLDGFDGFLETGSPTVVRSIRVIRVIRRRHSSWNLRVWASVVGVLFTTGAVRADQKPDSCVECHAAMPDGLGAPVEGMKHDVHAEHGLSCADCHGGDPTDPAITSMDAERGYRGRPAKAEIPDFCGRCHSDPAYMRRFNPAIPTDQRERYRTSVHGQRLTTGDEKVAVCTSCHGVHGIRSGRQVSSPVYPANIPATCGGCHSQPQYMAGYDIPTNQEEGYRHSVHGDLLLEKRDLSAPTCATCHDNHGASPPGLTSVTEVCGHCHANNAALFAASPHKPAFDRLGLAECATCHGNHEIHRTSDAMLSVNTGAPCGRCHEPNTPAYTATEQMRQTIEKLKEAIQYADAALQRAEAVGMEVSDARYEFHAVDGILIQARTAVHRFSPAFVLEVAAPGFDLAQRTERAAAAALAEALRRRANLLLPLGVIVLLMLLLAVKLRQLERETPRFRRPRR